MIRLPRRREKLAQVAKLFGLGKVIPAVRTVEFLEMILNPGRPGGA